MCAPLIVVLVIYYSVMPVRQRVSLYFLLCVLWYSEGSTPNSFFEIFTEQVQIVEACLIGNLGNSQLALGK